MPTDAAGNANVLVVDDHAAQRVALCAILGDLDVTIVEASSGRDALRCLLQQEFAVILLDVNMPGLDGFETAALIRQRRNCQHTPIIFVTAYSDDAHAARGYSLGAVDYILAPVQPDVLRTKVSVFIDLYRKTEEVTRQREALRRYAEQLQRLARASLAVHSARSITEVLETAVECAAQIVDARQAAIIAAPQPGTHAVRVTRSTQASGDVQVARATTDWSPEAAGLTAHAPQRMTTAEADADPPSGVAGDLVAGRPVRGWLAAPLTAHDSRVFGVVQLSEKTDGEFSEDDEGILMQLAQMASIAVENTMAAEAREANRLKDEFLGVLSHELRTPLQAMLTWISILRSDPSGNRATLARGLEVIERSARAQVQLIGDLLDVSRIIRGQLRLEIDTVDLVSIVELALETLKPAATAKQITVDWTAGASDCRLAGDAARLQQIVWNLVSNAIKFTPQGGRVTVWLGVEPAAATLTVRDTGGGIPPEFLPHVFERFRQGDSGSARTHGGLGLGLAIVRHLVELHAGMVRAENAADGALLTVRLPRRPPLASEPHLGGTWMPASPVRKDHDRLRLDGIHVVLVEDDPDARESLQAALQAFGAEVVAVNSAAAALHVLEQRVPHVLLSDIGMPGADGYALIRQVRARDFGARRLPAAAITAYVRPEDRASALRAGFDAHLNKPVEPLELAKVVKRLTERGS